MPKNFSKFLYYNKFLSFSFKDLLFTLVTISVLFACFLSSPSEGKVITKSDIPDWALQKQNMYFKGVSLPIFLSTVLPKDIKTEIDLTASKLLIDVSGNFSIDEILKKYQEKIEYEYKDNTLVVKGYVVRTYEIPYLPTSYYSKQTYESQGNYYVSTSGTTGSVTSGGSIASTSEKTSHVENKITIDFWTEIKNEIKEILGSVDIVEQQTQPVQTSVLPISGPQIKPPDSTTFMTQMPQTTPKPVMPSSFGLPKNFVTINKASGLLVVGCPVDKARLIDNYIKKIKDKLSESIEIDFTLVEVKDRNNVSTNISWETVLKNVLFRSIKSSIMGSDDVQIIGFEASSGSFSLVGKTKDQFTASGANKQNLVINALKEVADVKVLTKTNLLLKNNTTVGFNSGILTSFIDSLQGTSSETTSSYTINKGIVLSGIDIVISANVEGDNITLSIIPTISNLVDLEEKKFGDNLLVQNPTIETKKSVATVTLKNGETTAIVGYNLNNKTKQRQGLPLLGDIPLIGLFFSKNSVIDENASLIMLLTPKIKRM